MANGRSFSRNRKGSPAKSQRRARQRVAAQWRAESAIKSAVDSILSSNATQAALKTAAASLSAMSGGGVTVDEAEEMLGKLVEEQGAKP